MTLDLYVRQTRPLRVRTPVTRRLRHVLGVVAGGTAVVLLLPLVSGVPWAGVAAAVSKVPPSALLGLVVLWLAGLLAHTTTLAAALPGVGRARALLLSLTGSAVSNVLPAGGAAGIALNYRMSRDWGFDRAAFATYTVLTNVWDVLAKLALPAVALLVVWWWGPPGLLGTGHAALLVAVGSVAMTTALVVALSRPTGVDKVAGALNAVVGLAQRLLGRPRRPVLTAEQLAAWRDTTRTLAASSWGRLTSGMALYSALLFGLLAACLQLTGAGVPLSAVLLGFCVERLMTLVPITPGGLGLVEVGLVGVLALAPGGSAAGIASGVLVYRALTFGLEIPVGGALLAGWAWRRRGSRSAVSA